MKKILIFSCLLLTTSVAALAQLPNFTLGIKGGVNYSSLKTKDDLTNTNSILGYQAGVWTRVGFAGMYVQPELYLGSKGNDFKQTISGNEAIAKVRFTTLDLPILLGTKIGPSKLNLRFMAGPVISYIIDQKTTFDSGYAAVTDYNDYKDQAIGIQAGAGVDAGNLSVDLRYEAGLSNVNKSDKYDQKQNLFHLSLGYKIF